MKFHNCDLAGSPQQKKSRFREVIHSNLNFLNIKQISIKVPFLQSKAGLTKNI